MLYFEVNVYLFSNHSSWHPTPSLQKLGHHQSHCVFSPAGYFFFGAADFYQSPYNLVDCIMYRFFLAIKGFCILLYFARLRTNLENRNFPRRIHLVNFSGCGLELANNIEPKIKPRYLLPVSLMILHASYALFIRRRYKTEAEKSPDRTGRRYISRDI